MTTTTRPGAQVRCECGLIHHRKRCSLTCLENEVVLLQWVPPHRRDAAAAKGDWSEAVPVRAHPQCAPHCLRGRADDGFIIYYPWVRKAP